MAKIVVHNERDPQIAIVLEYVAPNTPGRARGYHGTCTECGWPMHRWGQYAAIVAARAHVDSHEPVMLGGDRDSLIR